MEATGRWGGAVFNLIYIVLSQEALLVLLPFPTFLNIVWAINKSTKPDDFTLSLRVSHHTAVINRH